MNPVIQFVEIIRAEHARIEMLKQAVNERGEIIVNITSAWLNGEIDEETYDDLIARTGQKGKTK